MPRGIKQINDVILILKLHHGTGDRNTALLFHFHPVTRGMTGGLAALDGTGELNGAAEKQELFGQCCFTSVRVRNNGKRTATLDLAENGLLGHP